jgi:hypothetical protein
LLSVKLRDPKAVMRRLKQVYATYGEPLFL